MKTRLFLLTFLVILGVSQSWAQRNYASWMSELDDDAFVCQVSIPGAHDAGTGGMRSGATRDAARTQSHDIPGMFNAGVRAFDMRPAVKKNGNDYYLELCHGVVDTEKTFDAAMDELVATLNSHPSEFAIIVIRHEDESSYQIPVINYNDYRSYFPAAMKASLGREQVKNYLVEFRPNLTVDEVRGKIIVLSRSEYTDGPVGGYLRGWTHNTDFNTMQSGSIQSIQCYNAPFWVQDHYEIGLNTADNIKSNKTDLITGLMNRSIALQGTYSYTWVINHTSGYTGTSTLADITSIATVTNKAVVDYLKTKSGPIGIIMEDYASANTYNYLGSHDVQGLACTQAVIENNFKYTMTKQSDIIYDGNNRYIAPRGRELMWTAKYVNRANSDGAPAINWYAEDFNDSSWGELRFPIANRGTNQPYYNVWDGENNTMYIRRKFELDKPIPCAFRLFHDDDYTLYVNGVELDFERDWMTDFNNYRQVLIPASLLHEGENVLAIKVVQNVGGAYFDCGVLSLVETADFNNVGVLPSTQYGNGLGTVDSEFDKIKWTAATWVKKQNAAGVIEVPNPVDGKAWYDPAYVATKENNWETHTSSFHQDGNYRWAGGDNCDICFRREFSVNGTLPSELYLSIGHDDLCDVYLNGHLIWSEDGKVKTGTDAPWGPWYNQDVIKLTAEEIGYIHTDGTVNVLAVHVHQNWGGYFADAGLYLAESSAATNYDEFKDNYDARLNELTPYDKYLVDNTTYQRGKAGVEKARSIHDYEFILKVWEPLQCVTYKDDETNSFEEKHYDAVIVKRSITPGNWSTLCLPFGMTDDQIKANFGKDAEVKELTGLTIDGNRYIMNFTAPTTEPVMIGGHPYVVNATASEKIAEIGVADVNIIPESDIVEPSATNNNYTATFKGSYKGVNVPEDDGNYIISSNKLYYVDYDKVNNKGFRGYFHLADKDGNPLRSLSISFDDDATGISTVNTESMNDGYTYNLAGQRIDTPVRGQMYIMNGKTFIAK